MDYESRRKSSFVGNGMVGHKFIDNILQSDSDEFDVITFSGRAKAGIRPSSVDGLLQARKCADDLALTSEEYYQSNGVNYLSQRERSLKLDTANQ